MRWKSQEEVDRKIHLKINDCFYIKIYTSNSHYEKCLNLFVEIILLTAYNTYKQQKQIQSA